MLIALVYLGAIIDTKDLECPKHVLEYSLTLRPYYKDDCREMWSMMSDLIGTGTKIVLVEALIFHLNPSHRLYHFFSLIHASSMIYEYQLHVYAILK